MNNYITKIIYSEPHNFYFDEKYHPGRGKEIAQKGWRAVAQISGNGITKTAEAILGLSKISTELSAKELALTEWQTAILDNKSPK